MGAPTRPRNLVAFDQKADPPVIIEPDFLAPEQDILGSDHAEA